MDKPLHQQLLDMLDFAHTLADKIPQDEPENSDYFCSTVYLEAMFDKYGRGMIRYSMQELGLQPQVIEDTMRSVNERVESLRKKIRHMVQTYDFDETLRNAGEELYQNWRKRPE